MSLQDVLTGESWIECSRDLLVLTRHVTGSQGKKRARKKGAWLLIRLLEGERVLDADLSPAGGV